MTTFRKLPIQQPNEKRKTNHIQSGTATMPPLQKQYISSQNAFALMFSCSYVFFLLTTAATFVGKPNKRIKPVASVGSYSAPILKLAKSFSYRLFGLFTPAGLQRPLNSFILTLPVTFRWVTLTKASRASRNRLNHRP